MYSTLTKVIQSSIYIGTLCSDYDVMIILQHAHVHITLFLPLLRAWDDVCKQAADILTFPYILLV